MRWQLKWETKDIIIIRKMSDNFFFPKHTQLDWTAKESFENRIWTKWIGISVHKTRCDVSHRARCSNAKELEQNEIENKYTLTQGIHSSATETMLLGSVLFVNGFTYSHSIRSIFKYLLLIFFFFFFTFLLNLIASPIQNKNEKNAPKKKNSRDLILWEMKEKRRRK